MNREHEFPNDPPYEPDSPESSARLDEVERRLKQARPRPPKLDIAALVRLAQQAAADTPVETPGAAVIRRRSRQLSTRRSRRVAALVGSWACGAMVGALATFALIGHTAPATDAIDETARHDQEGPTSVAREKSTIPEPGQRVEPPARPMIERKPDPPEFESAVLAMILDPFGGRGSAYWADGPTLRAGMHLRRHAREPLELSDRATDTAGPPRAAVQPRRAEKQGSPRPDRDPPSPPTRERLMRELLSKPSELLL